MQGRGAGGGLHQRTTHCGGRSLRGRLAARVGVLVDAAVAIVSGLVRCWPRRVLRAVWLALADGQDGGTSAHADGAQIKAVGSCGLLSAAREPTTRCGACG